MQEQSQVEAQMRCDLLHNVSAPFCNLCPCRYSKLNWANPYWLALRERLDQTCPRGPFQLQCCMILWIEFKVPCFSVCFKKAKRGCLIHTTEVKDLPFRPTALDCCWTEELVWGQQEVKEESQELLDFGDWRTKGVKN